jgi:hypothetical protein
VGQDDAYTLTANCQVSDKQFILQFVSPDLRILQQLGSGCDREAIGRCLHCSRAVSPVEAAHEDGQALLIRCGWQALLIRCGWSFSANPLRLVFNYKAAPAHAPPPPVLRWL